MFSVDNHGVLQLWMAGSCTMTLIWIEVNENGIDNYFMIFMIVLYCI